MLSNEDVRQLKRAQPFRNDKATIADDGFTIVTPNLQSGLLVLTVVDTGATFQGMFSFDTASGGATCVLVTTATGLEAATGVLNGTTGTDTKITVSAHTDGKLYIENRSGVSKNIHWLIIF